MGKREKETDTFLREKNSRKRKRCYHNDTCKWKKDMLKSEGQPYL